MLRLATGRGDMDSTQNRPFLRRFMERAVVSTEKGTMIDAQGVVTQAAIRRVQGALLARAYEDSSLVASLIETTDNNIKAIGGALLDATPEWATMRGSPD